MKTDQDIIDGLIARDNRITEEFFYVKCRPLLTAIMRLVFSYPVEYNELVSELYNYLMANDGEKLRQFQFRSSIYQWIKVVATRFFIRHRDSMIDPQTKEDPYVQIHNDISEDSTGRLNDKIDLNYLLNMMDNRRHSDVIRKLVLEDVEPEKYAAEIGVSVDNLYNIKKRAISSLSRIATKYYSYGK